MSKTDHKGLFTKNDPRRGKGGRSKVNIAFRERARKLVDEHVLSAWENEIVARGEYWVRCSEMLAAYGYGRPTQHIEARVETLSHEEALAALE